MNTFLIVAIVVVACGAGLLVLDRLELFSVWPLLRRKPAPGTRAETPRKTDRR